MIDYTHPARERGRDSDLATALRAAADHTERLVRQAARAGADPTGEVNDWYDTVQRVADACARAAAVGHVPSPDEARTLDTWLLRATDCLGACRRLLRAARHLIEPPLTDAEVLDAYLALLDLTHVVHESADHVRRSLAVRRGGIPPREAPERFVRSRIAHQDLMRRALRLLPDEDARRDEWMFRYVVLAQRVAEYGGDSPGEAEAARATAEELARPGSRLDDAQRAQMRAAGAALATQVHTGGDAARATGAADLALAHRAVWRAAQDDPLAAARFGAELLRAVTVGENVDGLGLHDAVAALEHAVRTMDPGSPEWPEALAARALARTQVIGTWSVRERDIGAVVNELDGVRGLLPPGHPLTAPVDLALVQLLSLRGSGEGSLSDIRSALAMLRRARVQHPADPMHRLVLDAVFAQVHTAFHYHAGADDADCTGTGDEATPAVDRVGHAARTTQLLRLCVDRARRLADTREDHSPELLALVQHTLGWSLLMAATYTDGGSPPGGGERYALLSEARTVLSESLSRTDERSPQRAGRELLLHIACFVEAQAPTAPPGAARPPADAIGLLVERPDVSSRPPFQDTVRAVHFYARTLMAHTARGGEEPGDRDRRLRQMEEAVAARPEAVDTPAVDLRMQLAREHRAVNPAPAGLGDLLVRAARPGRSSAAGGRAGRERSRRLGWEALGLLARRALVQEVAADAVLTAERAGPLSREVAGWCVADGALEEAVGTLERGRALALHTEMVTVDVLSTLSGLGRADLAGEWRGWRDAALRQDRAGRRPDGTATGPGAALGEGAGGDAWDSYAEHPVPERLGARVRAVLEEHGALDTLLGTVPVPEIAAALRRTGNHELVYLLPTQNSPVSGGALRVRSDGGVRWTPLSGLADPSSLDAYTGALELLLSAPRADAVEHAWRARLEEVCDWAGRAVVEHLARDAGGAGADCPRRLVLVPLGALVAVPWSAARLPGAGGRPGRAVERMVLSTAPSARMFVAAAGRPPVRAGDDALLVLGLTGEQARVSSSRALHRLYPRPRLLAPETGRPSGRPVRGPDGTTRPAEVLDEIRRAALSHGIVDVSAHLLPDPSDSWRSHLAFGAAFGADGTPAGDIDRLSVQTIAAQRFPVPPDGPGLCVSLASCMNGLPRRHPDESFTMAAAFLAGGASSVLGSLWLVRLHATALVDLLFHHGLRTGHAPVDALRQAQLWMAGPVREPPASMPADVRRLAADLLNALTASGHDPADPAFWAGLVVVGR
ncbi:CHAT domain-containing protein [Streptomyces sp. NBC_01460]|uniref:CHAT domain-containing protein n=1 Tax=Streptomyces sp. NBC_01460 TaxID=2903875 RepID=UPI002E337A71|nr:CHAT domain-containing protein [Streptomyces sp. NBC_01460]